MKKNHRTFLGVEEARWTARIVACAAAAVLAVMPFPAHANPTSAEPICERPDVLFCEDWEDGDHAGWDWSSNWDCGDPATEACIEGTGGFASDNALRLRIQAGDGTTSNPGGDTAYPGNNPSFSPIDARSPVFLRWYIKYSPGYVFMRLGDGQKILYMRGVRDTANWQNLVAASASNDLSQFEITQSTHFHDNIRRHNGDATRWLESDEWYCVEWEMKCNSGTGAADGHSRIWVDDVPYMDHTQEDMDCGDSAYDSWIDEVPWISAYYGGNPGPAHPEQFVWYDQIVVGRERIGCGAAFDGGVGSSTVPPPPPNNVERTDTVEF